MTIRHVPDRWAPLSALVVDDVQRSCGIGAAPLQVAEAFAREHGCAHRFYERQGYREKRVRLVKTPLP